MAAVEVLLVRKSPTAFLPSPPPKLHWSLAKQRFRTTPYLPGSSYLHCAWKLWFAVTEEIVPLLVVLIRSWGLGGFLGGSVVEESACSVEDLGSIPELGRTPGEGNSNPLQYSGLENSMDRGSWCPSVHGVAKSWT